MQLFISPGQVVCREVLVLAESHFRAVWWLFSYPLALAPLMSGRTNNRDINAFQKDCTSVPRSVITIFGLRCVRQIHVGDHCLLSGRMVARGGIKLPGLRDIGKFQAL